MMRSYLKTWWTDLKVHFDEYYSLIFRCDAKYDAPSPTRLEFPVVVVEVYLQFIPPSLEDTCSSDEEQDTSYIPIEEVLEFKSRINITEKRQELRQNLRQKFAQLCVNPHTPPVILKQGKNPA